MQKELFVETLAEALESAIAQLGGNKRVGTMLWPEKPALEAGKQLANCLHHDHAQKLSLDQIDFIVAKARAKEIHDVHKYLCDTHNYKFEPISKESIKADIQTQINSNLGEIKTLISRLESIK